MGWEVDSTSKIQGKTSASASIGGGRYNYSGDSEHLLINARSEDWYIGVKNENISSDSGFFIGQSSKEDSIFEITQSGNVGIGTSTPSTKLDVDGTINASALTVNGVSVATSSSTFWSEAGSLLSYGTNPVDVTNATDASDATGDTGAIRTEGGVSIAKKLYVNHETFLGVAGDKDVAIGASGNGSDLYMYSATADHVGVHWDHDLDTNGTLKLGVDNHGIDLIAYGESAGKYMQWDQSADELLFGGGAGIKFDTASDINVLNASATALTVSETSGNTLITIDTSNEEIEIDNAKLVVSNDIIIDTENELKLSHASSTFNLDSTVDSTAADGGSGAIQCLGGVSIAKNLYVGQSGTSAKLVFDGNGGVDFNGSGAIKMDAGAASNLTTSSGNLTLQAGASVDIIGALGAADAILLNTSNAAGGIDINAGTNGIDIDTTGAFHVESTLNTAATDGDSSQNYTSAIKVDGGINEALLLQSTQGTGPKSINLFSVAGGIHIETSAAKDIQVNAGKDLELYADDDIEITAGYSGASGGSIEIDATSTSNGIKIGTGTATPVELGLANNASSDVNISGTLHITSNEDLANGAASNLNRTADFFSTSGTETATLAAGSDGQVKIYGMTGDGGDMTITVTNAAWKTSGTGTIAFDTDGEGCILMYMNSKWHVIGNNGGVFA